MEKDVGSGVDLHEVLDPVLGESFTGTPDIITKCRGCDDNFGENAVCLRCELGKVLKGGNTDLDKQTKNDQ